MGWRYKVACNPLGTVHNSPLASDLGKEINPPTLIMIYMYGGQVKRERDL